MSNSQRPHVWFIGGAPGSGKSSLGRALAAKLGAGLLDLDVLTGHLTDVVAQLVGAEPGDLDDARVRDALGDAPYDALLDGAHDNLAVGLDVVLVAPFTRAFASIDAARETFRRLGDADVHVLWTTCPPEELMRRLRNRAAPRDRRKFVDQDAFLDRVAQLPVIEHMPIDATVDIEIQVDSARRAPVIHSP